MAARVRRHRKAVAGSQAAQATFEKGLSSGQRELREKAAKRRVRAIELLADGMCPVEVDDALGMARGWCSEQAGKHPALGRAVRKQAAE